MFDRITRKFLSETRPILMHKVEKRYRNISYAEYRTKVEQCALGLRELGVKIRDKVAIISENRPEWVITDMAVVLLGAVSVPIYPTLTAKQIEYIFNDAGVSVAVVSNQSQLNKVLKIRENLRLFRCAVMMSDRPESLTEPFVFGMSQVYDRGAAVRKENPEFIGEMAGRAKPSDLVTIIYTSGTTGDPKGVMLSHDNLVANLKASTAMVAISPKDTFLSFLPLCHSFERMGGYYLAMACGSTVAYAESAETVRDNLIEVRPTVMTTVPRLFERIQSRLMKQVESGPASKRMIFRWALSIGRDYAAARKNGRVAGSLILQHLLAKKFVLGKLQERTGGRIRFFISGGAALPREIGEFFEAFGIIIIEGYGLTETSPVLCGNSLEHYEFGTVGRPLPGVRIKIAQDGEILAKGPNVMLGYYNNPAATAEVIDKEGWFHTGDVGAFNSRGNLAITDRKKHLFVSSGGKNIAPQPIENLFLQSKYIDQFVLIGDRRMFLSALIVPDFDALQEYADRNSIAYGGITDLVKNPQCYSIIEQDIQTLQKDLANFERVRKFALLDRQFSVEEGELTPTLKVKRKIVEARFAHIIDEMYRHVA